MRDALQSIRRRRAASADPPARGEHEPVVHRTGTASTTTPSLRHASSGSTSSGNVHAAAANHVHCASACSTAARSRPCRAASTAPAPGHAGPASAVVTSVVAPSASTTKPAHTTACARSRRPSGNAGIGSATGAAIRKRCRDSSTCRSAPAGSTISRSTRPPWLAQPAASSEQRPCERAGAGGAHRYGGRHPAGGSRGMPARRSWASLSAASLSSAGSASNAACSARPWSG